MITGAGIGKKVHKVNGGDERNSNLELLRIICIIAIIGDHFTGQSGIVERGSFTASLFYSTVISLSRVSCSVFIIISAWFSIEKSFGIKKIFHTWLTVIMYTIPISLYLFNIGVIGKESIYMAMLPVEESPLWFAGFYIILVFLSPILNMLLNKAPRRIIECFLLILFVFMVLYPTLTANLGYFSHDIWILIFLYVLTGYIKKFLNKPKSDKSFLVFFLVWGCLTGIRAIASYNEGSNLYIWALIKDYGEIYRSRLQTLPNIIIAYSLFFGFMGLKVKKSTIINTLASATLGVYCFHQVPGWYNYMWKNIFKADFYSQILHGKTRAFYTIISILMVWIVGTIIELARSKISSYAIESKNWYAACCNKIDRSFDIINVKDTDVLDRKVIKKIIIVFTVYFLVAKFISIGHYWYIPLSTDRSLIGENLLLSILEDVDYSDGDVKGEVYVTNNGAAISNLSSGRYPVNLGISIVDSEKNIVFQDLLHTSIRSSGVLNHDDIQTVAINLEKMQEYAAKGYGIRFEVVQENISWFDDTAIYYWFD